MEDELLKLFKGYLRPMLNHLKDNYNIPTDGLVGVEIGVRRGYNSACILNNLPIKCLYLIDPYRRYKEIDVSYNPSVEYLYFKELILDRYNNIKFIKKMSHDAVEDIPNELDFVYIDGNHKYQYIKDDINDYYGKVKKCGYFGGHDYDRVRHHNHVKKAVDRFIEEKHLKLYSEKKHDPYSKKKGEGATDWWIIKERV